MSQVSTSFISLARNSFKFTLFLLAKLPSAYFAGVRLREIDEKHCRVTVPFKWFSQNPFRSTYFACLNMAGELSTGALGMAYVYKSKPAVSMLVVRADTEFFKKATGRTTFICDDGELFGKMIGEAIATGEPRTVRAKSIGRNEAGEVVCEMFVTWSFKAKR